ncbi:hypothetical protein GCM10027180_23280 [Microbulbifer echini]
MEIAEKLGVKIWVSLGSVFFEGDGKKSKREDYKERWQRAKRGLLPYKNIIYAFDPLDEPFHKSLLPDNELKAYLEEIGSFLKLDFPKAKRAITFTSYTVERPRFQLVIPENFNLFGVDHYVGVDFQGEIVNRLIMKTEHMNAKYYLIPRAFKTTSHNYRYLQQAELVLRARQAYNFAIANSKIELIYPFQWKSFFWDSEHYYGVDSFPELRREYEKIGRSISKDR